MERNDVEELKERVMCAAVLEKAGFHLVGEDGAFKYYRIER